MNPLGKETRYLKGKKPSKNKDSDKSKRKNRKKKREKKGKKTRRPYKRGNKKRKNKTRIIITKKKEYEKQKKRRSKRNKNKLEPTSSPSSLVTPPTHLPTVPVTITSQPTIESVTNTYHQVLAGYDDLVSLNSSQITVYESYLSTQATSNTNFDNVRVTFRNQLAESIASTRRQLQVTNWTKTLITTFDVTITDKNRTRIIAFF